MRPKRAVPDRDISVCELHKDGCGDEGSYDPETIKKLSDIVARKANVQTIESRIPPAWVFAATFHAESTARQR